MYRRGGSLVFVDGDRVAVMERNSPAYVESYLAALKLVLVACNVKYKYRPEELQYLLEDSGPAVLVINEDFLPTVELIAAQCPQLEMVVVIGPSARAAPPVHGLRGPPCPRTVRPRCHPTRSAPTSAGSKVDGSLTLLGRGSGVINTGGEKVIPEEVENVIHDQPGVADCVVVGAPDARYGQVIAALIEFHPGRSGSLNDIAHQCSARLANYKKPRHLFVVDKIPRTDNGKMEYVRAREIVAERLQQLTPSA